jgi:hypothetical protein
MPHVAITRSLALTPPALCHIHSWPTTFGRLLGIFSAHGVLPLDFKLAYCVGNLIAQQLDELQREAEQKGGVQQMLADHFAKVYRVSMPLAA